MEYKIGFIFSQLSDKLSDPKLRDHPSPLLLIDPAYDVNVGDNLIALGEIILMERMGFLNHTECNIIQSKGKSKDCENFQHIQDGGLAFWHGGGNWGDLWMREGLLLRRMDSFIKLLRKGKTIIGKLIASGKIYIRSKECNSTRASYHND